jgi:hypothetical protein
VSLDALRPYLPAASASDSEPEDGVALVRGASAGDVARSEFLGQWLADLNAALHTHHESEDGLLWDKLEQSACLRAACRPDARAARTGRGAARRGEPAPRPVACDGRPGGRRTAADAYERMLDVLKVHLRREVVKDVPVAERVVGAEEWTAMAEHSRGVIPKSRLQLQLGMLHANSTPAERLDPHA